MRTIACQFPKPSRRSGTGTIYAMNPGMNATSPTNRRDELNALRHTDPDQISEAYRRAMLGLGQLPRTPYVSFTRMIEAIIAHEERHAIPSADGHSVA